ncbi:MAG: DUF2243 domain-containing protein [Opitutaceae bacterium]|nr:DUF2243 domain-containing protein [Opitutaceae bacterium]
MLFSPAEHLERFKRPSLFRAGCIIGIGMGGFFDGILFHQILGWHHLICRTEFCAPADLDMLLAQNTEDGWFHLAMWLTTAIGIGMLLRAAKLGPTPFRPRALAGGALFGWGVFNFVEGLVNHQLLAIHHVRPGDSNWVWWDLAFLAWGAVMMVLGWRGARS